MENRHDAQFRPASEAGVMSGAAINLRGATSSIHRLLLLVLAALAALAVITASPASAHKNEAHEAAPRNEQATADRPTVGTQGMETMEGMDMNMDMDRSQMPFFQRLGDWLGRIHPALVHFPIAFFPAAWFTAIVGRRRPAFSAPVQFLVVAGGIFAPIAAAAGWLAGITADPEPILQYHRWLGVAIGVAGAGLGFWAWRRPWEDRGAGMILALTLMTVAIAVQGFLGAAVTHGMEHLMF